MEYFCTTGFLHAVVVYIWSTIVFNWVFIVAPSSFKISINPFSIWVDVRSIFQWVGMVEFAPIIRKTGVNINTDFH
jgi:hypothetical protein